MLDVRELLRTVQMGEGSIRRVARDLGLSRKTVVKYRAWAVEQEILAAALPEPAALNRLLEAILPEVAPPRAVSKVEPYRQRVLKLRGQGVECRAILERLPKEAGFAGSYDSPGGSLSGRSSLGCLTPAYGSRRPRARRLRWTSAAGAGWRSQRVGSPPRPGPSRSPVLEPPSACRVRIRPAWR